MTLDLVPAQNALTGLQTSHIAQMALKDTEIRALTERVAELEAQLAPAPFVRFANWWCADGWRDGARVLHHLEEYGADSPEVAAFRVLAQDTSGPEFSWDISNLGNDKLKPDAQKIASHKSLFGVDAIRHVRVFFGTAVPRWDDERFLALTDKDSAVVSTLSRDRAGVANFYASTPDRFRQRPAQILAAHGHEREANLLTATALSAWLDGNAELADILDGTEGYSTDNLIKITLWYSQQLDQRAEVPSREQMYGGQDFGIFGEDCYSPRHWSRYATPAEMFGPITEFCRSIGRPCAIPEWGAERVPTDTTGSGRARFIIDGGAFLQAATAA